MIVHPFGCEKVLRKLTQCPYLSLDCETTGLSSFHDARPFSIIISDGNESFYFDLKHWWLGLDGNQLQEEFHTIFDDTRRIWFLANAKFDMHMLKTHGIELKGSIHCIQANGRVLRNDKFKYGLDALAAEIGLEKSGAVEEYIEKNNCERLVPDRVTGEIEKVPAFDLVPLEIMQPYAEQDALITFKIGISQLEHIKHFTMQGKDITRVVNNERALTKVCYSMEQRGILIDRQYVEYAYEHEKSNAHGYKREFERLAGVEFVDSAKVLKPIFIAHGLQYGIGKTKGGADSFKEEFLTDTTNPLVSCLLGHRHAMKNASTYYENFLRYMDSKNVLHAQINPDGTKTGRFSYSNPNLQNLPKREDERSDSPWDVRKSFIPRPGTVFVEMDYSQAEYRLMLDYAAEMTLIEQVIAGVDLHEATGKMMDVTRKRAKTLNFMLLYGGGVQKLATGLGTAYEEAATLRAQYFSKLPKVTAFIKTVQKKAEQEGVIYDWLGRPLYFSEKRFCYKAPNGLIQGGVGDICKVAMVNIEAYLWQQALESRMIVQVHDSLLFEIPEHELHVVPVLKKIMEDAYPHKRLPMKVDVGISRTNWAEITKMEVA